MIETTRRGLITHLLAMAGAALASATTAPRWSRAQDTGTTRRGDSDNAFMERALSLRRRAVEAGDQGYGAVVVKDGRIVGEPAAWS